MSPPSRHQAARQVKVAPTYQEARARLLAARQGPGHVLGLDQATATGWALFDLISKRCVLSGRSVSPDGEREVVATLTAHPGLDWASTLVVFEDHSTFPIAAGTTSARVLLSLGESRQRWKTLLSDAGHSPEARLLVPPHDWRKLLGTRANVGRDAWKQQAVMWASALVGRQVAFDDEAEAIVIGMWGVHEGLIRWATRRAEQGATARKPRRKKQP